MSVKVRVIRTYEVDVDAQYGDTPDDLAERANDSITSDTDYAETAVILDEEHS